MAAHDLHYGAALMGLHGVPQAVDALHGSIGRRIKANGILCADDILVDGAGNAHHGDTVLVQCLRTPEGAVAANGHNAIQSQELAGVHRLLLPRLGAELVTAGGVKYGAAPVNDAADAGIIHGHNVAVDEAVPAPADPHAFDAPADSRADYGTDAGVHTRRVAAAGEDSDPFYSIFHIHCSFWKIILGFSDYSTIYNCCESFFLAPAAAVWYTFCHEITREDHHAPLF